MRPVACLGLLATLSLSGAVLPVAAHPHSWIDMVSQLQIDDRQRLTELRLSWLFDEFYSATILDEAQSKGHSLEQELVQFGQDTLNNLATENYLNRMTLDGQKIRFGRGDQVKTEWVNGQIRLSYRLPLAQPAPLTGKRLQFAIYDSTYYVEMLHGSPTAIQLRGQGATGCHTELLPPNPSEEQRSYALSLDKTEQSEDGLGTAFAEQVMVLCSPQPAKGQP
ncbi:MAG: DUF1007 family protein [Aeromonadaceae bacterium]